MRIGIGATLPEALYSELVERTAGTRNRSKLIVAAITEYFSNHPREEK